MTTRLEKVKLTQAAKTAHLKTKKEIGEIVLQNRLSLRLSREHLGKRAGVTGHTVYLIEAGKTMPTDKTLEGLAQAFGFSPSTFHKDEKQAPQTATFIGQEHLDEDDKYYYYTQLLTGLEIKCLAYDGDGILNPTPRAIKNATLDVYIGEEHWFLDSICNAEDSIGVVLFNRKKEFIVLTHTDPRALTVLQELLAARWRPNPLNEDEE